MSRHICLRINPVSAKPLRTAATYRIYLLGGILFLWCGVIGLRLLYLQIFRYGDFEQRAQHQQQRAIDVSPKRGIIYDRAGHELAMSMLVDSAFAVPTEIPDLPNTISLLARITKQDPRVLLADCQAHKTFCWVARKGDSQTIRRLRDLNLQGIHYQKEAKRFYPNHELAAQVLGYVGTDDEGLSGIEREYDEHLHGQPGEMLISVDARKKWFGRVEKQPEPGDNVVLTIDENIQYIAERELKQAIQDTKAVAGTIIVENPRTGEVLALANWPTFDPNNRKEIRSEALKNRAVSDVYEPGSTFKVVTVSGALEEKITRPDEVFDCQMGAIVINGMRIRDHKPFGLLPVSGIIANSSDVGAIKIALRLGEERFYKYIRAFGFGQQTGIELPGETRGLAKPVNRWSKVSIGAISMGQEIGVSPLQLVGMISTIANDGTWVAPRIVAASTQPQSGPQTVVFHPAIERRVVSTLTAAQMKEMLQGVVLHGTGRKAILEGYSAAGKTGTAQKLDPATGTYSRTKYVASFAGFAPINNPAITVAVILDSAVGPHQGGQVAAPVFQRVSQQVLEFLHVPHDVELPPNRQVLLAERHVKDEDLAESSPDHLGASLEVAEAAPSEASPAATSPIIPKPSPSTQREVVIPAALREKETGPTSVRPSVSSKTLEVTDPKQPNGTVVLDIEQGGIEVPSFMGKTVRAAIESAQDSGLELEVAGSGTARDQTPAPGSHVPAGSRIMVRFAH
jgi:cell division protein FtsI (penicillin-binding protein 3)